MQGQASKGVALTAYVIIAFAQNEVILLVKFKIDGLLNCEMFRLMQRNMLM